MTSVRFCTACGGTVVAGVCGSCGKKVAAVAGWETEPAPPPAAAPSTPDLPPPSTGTNPFRPGPVGPAPVGYPVNVGSAPVPPIMPPPTGPVAPLPPPMLLPPPPAAPPRSAAGPIVLIVILLLIAAAGTWWLFARSADPVGRHLPTPPPSSTSVPPSAAATARKTFGVIRFDLPRTFVAVAGTPAGVAEFGDTATKPTEYIQVSRGAMAVKKSPAAYTAAEITKLGEGWQAQAIAAAAGTSCRTPTGSRKAGSVGTARFVDIVVTCKDANGVGTTVRERRLIAPDGLAYRIRLVAPDRLWTKDAKLLIPILPSVALS